MAADYLQHDSSLEKPVPNSIFVMLVPSTNDSKEQYVICLIHKMFHNSTGEDEVSEAWHSNTRLGWTPQDLSKEL